ncbi:MAG: S1 RNA-binding domain-containing protein [Candidatus Aerophobetes bacterium]|nr:S1 RNA-binding domain-containing protein [Candidatus Aerophobetes bacterium]
MSESEKEEFSNKTSDDGMERRSEEESFCKVIKKYGNFQPAKKGDIIEGKVVQISRGGVLLNVGAKSEGFMPWQEFPPGEEKKVKVEQIMQVYVLNRNERGHLLLSKKEADFRLNWAKFEEALKRGIPIVVKIEKVIKGGLMASSGPLNAFIPASHISLKRKENLKRFIGKNLPFKVVELDKNSKNIVLSRKLLLVEEKGKKKKKVFATLKEGNMVTGRVNSITKFGVFVDLGGIDGLIHPEDLSWGWVNDIHNILSIGEKIKVKVLKIDKKKEKISLGLKQTKPDPWTEVEKKYQVDSEVEGRVTQLKGFGAFLELEEGVEGLIHISELSWDKRVEHPREILREGEKVKAKILDIDVQKKKISLGLKQTKPDPWQELLQKYKVGDIVSAEVRQITKFGIFVNLVPGIDGLIHISELDKEYVSHPQKVATVGSKIEAEIVEINKEKRRVRLSIRQLKEKKGKDKDKKNTNLYSYIEDDKIVIGDLIEDKMRKKLKREVGNRE